VSFDWRHPLVSTFPRHLHFWILEPNPKLSIVFLMFLFVPKIVWSVPYPFPTYSRWPTVGVPRNTSIPTFEFWNQIQGFRLFFFSHLFSKLKKGSRWVEVLNGDWRNKYKLRTIEIPWFGSKTQKLGCHGNSSALGCNFNISLDNWLYEWISCKYNIIMIQLGFLCSSWKIIICFAKSTRIYYYG